MERTDFNWGRGKVVFWDLQSLDERRPLVDQLFELKEDLAQIEYPGDVLVDVGWYPSMSPEGQFTISVVAGQDWESPLSRVRCRTTAELREAVNLAARMADELTLRNRRP